MIPRKIHYCWYGRRPFPGLVKKCMASWKKHCPDYQVVRWDETNSPLEDNLYIRQAYRSQRWAFVSDYVRLYGLEKDGGIYLDTDVELLRPLDPYLEHDAFLGFESPKKIATCVIGAAPQHALIQEIIGSYSQRTFQRADGSLDETTNVDKLTELLLGMGLCRDGSRQTVAGAEVYPAEFFSPKSLGTGRLMVTENTVAIHHFQASWMSPRQRLHTYIAQRIGEKNTEMVKRWLGRKQ